MNRVQPSTVLAISSQVACGHVGLSAIVPALQRMGHDVIALPTVLLSAHPGHGGAASVAVAPEQLEQFLEAHLARGWLDGVGAVLTGYLPSVAHVRFAADAVRRLKAQDPRRLYVCDPVLGDEPHGLYIDAAAAAAIRDELVPLADVITPNRFEWDWLGRPASCPAVVTSAHDDGTTLSSHLVDGGVVLAASVASRPGAPHGTGDLLAALLTGHLLADFPLDEAFARSIAGVDEVLVPSVGCAELALVSRLGAAVDAAPAALVVLAQTPRALRR